MIINSLSKNKIKILIDEFDLNNAKIPLKKWISNSEKTLDYIKILLNFNIPMPIKSYSIYTYNYRIFLIEIFL